ncbi:MAG: 3'-5' exonuclease [Anaerolineales bacterium]|nr:3'-5' exonuclease [Anaerolineales bacterium]
METGIVIDIEAAGPNPGTYSMLSLGACTLKQPQHTFYIELQPVTKVQDVEAMQVHSLDFEALRTQGLPPAVAMQQFEAWLNSVIPAEMQPLFIAFNAPFDWMFVADYFQRYLGRNPFGHKALDIKAFYMGLKGVAWEDTSHQVISQAYGHKTSLSHHARRDAIDEAELFRLILADAGKVE